MTTSNLVFGVVILQDNQETKESAAPLDLTASQARADSPVWRESEARRDRKAHKDQRADPENRDSAETPDLPASRDCLETKDCKDLLVRISFDTRFWLGTRCPAVMHKLRL